MPDDQHLISLPPEARERVSREIEALQQDTTAPYTEVDLLVAAFREHIDDLRSESDFLRDEVARLHERLAALERMATPPAWLWRGIKPPRTR